VRFEAPGGAFEDIVIAGYPPYEIKFLLEGQKAAVRLGKVASIDPCFTGVPEDALYPRVGILDVIDGVFVGRLLREVKVELKVGITLAHEKEEAAGIAAHLVEDLPERRELAGARRHAHRFALLDEGDELDQQEPQVLFVPSQGLNGCPEPRDVSVVVGTPYVDEDVVGTFELVEVIGDI
jgi:hypothetical protein